MYYDLTSHMYYDNDRTLAWKNKKDFCLDARLQIGDRGGRRVRCALVVVLSPYQPVHTHTHTHSTHTHTLKLLHTLLVGATEGRELVFKRRLALLRKLIGQISIP